jgi:hypothetical protein
MTVDVGALAKLASEATPGPWRVIEDYRVVAPVSQETIGEATISPDAAYIAAASPDVILALIRDLKQSRIAMDEMRLFARHSSECAYSPTYPDGPEATCDCGFDSALRVYDVALADLGRAA